MAIFKLNGEPKPLGAPHAPLIDVVRETHGLTGTKLVCGAGVCGACTVLVDGKPVVSCVMPASAVADRAVTTVEGIGAERLHPVQKAFMAHDALQCGFCTPGFIVEAAAFHDAWRASRGQTEPSREEIASAFAGHLCRCGAYVGIYRAVAEACAGKFDGPETAPPRVEARAKVTGAAKYTVDVRLPGQLEGLILRSPHAHARVLAIDCTLAKAAAGVSAAVPLVAAGDVVRFFGAPVAAVAATDMAMAKAALARIRVDYQPLPSAVGYDASRAKGAPRLYSGWRKKAPNIGEGLAFPAWWRGNVRGPSSTFSLKGRRARSTIANARQGNDPFLVEGIWRADAQCHTSFEPHAAVARFDRGSLVVHLSTQAAHHLAGRIAGHFGLSPGKVRVVAEHVGGGFGSKLGLMDETIAAVTLARAAKAPVRVAFDRHEELSVAGYRPGAEMEVSLLPSSSGALKALCVKATGDTGVGINSTIASLGRFIYSAEAKSLEDYDAVSNLAPGAPFRGPGGPVLCFALEQAIDEAAELLQVDPIALRQRLDPDPNRQRLYRWSAGLPIWRGRQPTGSQQGRMRRGIGAAAANWLYLYQPVAEMELAVRSGRLVASMALQDMGTGSRSVVAATIARSFGLEPEEIEVKMGDSTLPRGPISGGSRTTPTIVPAALAAAERLQDELGRKVRRGRIGDNAPWREILANSPDISVRSGRPDDSSRDSPGARSPFASFGLMGFVFDWVLTHLGGIKAGRGAPGALHIAEVEVDTWLGHVRVLRVYAGLAIGRPQVPLLARSQAEGSIIQGLGYALYEGRQVDPATGAVLTTGLEDYRIPGIADTPQMHIHFEESGFEHVPGGGVGLAEVSTLPVAAAIANAIYNATGRRPRELPIRPDRLLALLGDRRSA